MKTIKDIQCYEPKDFLDDTINKVIIKAGLLWQDRCVEYIEANGDQGSCVLGAGISIDFIPPHKRTPRRLQVISADSVSHSQGSLVWEASKDEVLKVFEDAGIKVHYDWGNLD